MQEMGQLKNPPVVEAIVGLRLAGGALPESDLAALIERFKIRYAGEQSNQVQVQLNVQNDEVTRTELPIRILLYDENKHRTVSVGADQLSVHVLKPYPGWAAFRDDVQEALRAIAEVTGRDHVLETTIRYIDRIAIPEGAGKDLTTYFSALPRRPNGMPDALTAFQAVTEARDLQTGTITVLTNTMVPPSAGERFVMLYDLNVFRRFTEDNPLPLADVMAVLETLHTQQKLIFSDTITPNTLELFA